MVPIRPLTLAICFAGASTVSAQDLSKPVTYTTVAVPAAKAVAGLAKVSGVHLETGATMANDYVVVRLVDVPTSEAMKRIAATLNAEWEPTKTGFRLTRTDRLAREEKARELDAVRAQVARLLAIRRSSLESQGAFDQAKARTVALRQKELAQQTSGADPASQYRQRVEVGRLTPGGRLSSALIAGLDVDEVAAIPRFRRRVFATNPTRMQRPLSAASPARITKYVEEQKLFATELAAAGVPEQEIGSESSPAKIIVSVTRYPGNLIANVAFYDALGSELFESSETLAPDPSWLQDTIAKSGADEELALSPLNVKIHTALSLARFGNNRLPGRFEQEVRAALLQPEERDPLSFVASELLISMAERRDENLFAVLPDDMTLGWMFSPEQKLTTRDVLAAARTRSLDVSEAEGWLLLTPTEPSWARETRIDRAALGRTLRALDRNGTLTIEEQAAYALGVPQLPYDFVGAALMHVIAPSIRLLDGVGSLDALRLFGLLTPQQRKEAASDSGIAFRQLSAAQLDLANRIVFGNRYSVRVRPKVLTKETYLEALKRSNWTQLMEESTQCLGDGFPGAAVLWLTDVTETVAKLGSQLDEDETGQFMNARDLGYKLYAQDHPELFIGMRKAENRTDTSKLRTATRRTVDLHFQFSDFLATETLLATNGPPSERTMTLEELPAEFRNQIKAQYEDAARVHGNRKPIGDPSPPPGKSPPSRT